MTRRRRGGRGADPTGNAFLFWTRAGLKIDAPATARAEGAADGHHRGPGQHLGLRTDGSRDGAGGASDGTPHGDAWA